MKNRILMIFSLLLIVLIICYLLFLPTPVDYSSGWAETDKDGTVLQECDIVLKGWTYRQPFRNKTMFVPTQVDIPGYDCSNIINAGLVSCHSPACLTGCTFLKKEGAFLSADIVWHENRSCCVIWIDGRFFATSSQRDYTAALDLFHSILAVE